MATISNSTGTYSKISQSVEVRTKTYEAAAVPQADVIEMIEVKKGELVVDVHVYYDALGASSSISVGDGGAANRFIGTTTTTSAGRANMNTAADVGPGYTYAADDTIDVTAVGAGALTGTIRVVAEILRTY